MPKLDPTKFFPCGTRKPQPVSLRANWAHYDVCSHADCKERIVAREVMLTKLRNRTHWTEKEDES